MLANVNADLSIRLAILALVTAGCTINPKIEAKTDTDLNSDNAISLL